MPFYPYECPEGHEFEIVKTISQIDRVEECPECGLSCDKSRRRLAPGFFLGADDWNTAHYSNALGQVVNSRKHAAQVAKSKGLIEVGNEKPEKIHRHYKAQRDKAREDRWNKDESGPIETLTTVGDK